MPGRLEHSPPRIIQEYLIQYGYGTDPNDWPDDGTDIPNGIWPVYESRDPDRPDDVIQVNGTSGKNFGYTQVDSEREEIYGIQIIVRSLNNGIGFRKASSIAVLGLDRINRVPITLSIAEVSTGAGAGTVGVDYIIHSVERTSEATFEGRDTPQGKRIEHSINCLATIRQCFSF